jgi:hypothetical protein
MGNELEHVQEGAQAPARVVPPRPKTDDWALVIRPIADLAEQVAGTEFVPAALRGKPAAVTAAVLFGRELDMPPMQALQQVHVIEGRPSLSAEHMRAMVLAAGHILRVSGDGGQATAIGRRRLQDGSYDEPVTVTWNIQMAQAAGLTSKKNWQKHPRQMLKARATAELCRDLFPDITHGLDSLEEAEDEAGATGPATDPGAKARVSRRKGGDSGQAPGPAGQLPPVAGGPGAAPQAAAGVPAPPLPGEEAPAAATAGATRVITDAKLQSATVEGGVALTDVKTTQQCPHISNGVQCTWFAGHVGTRHSYDNPHEPLPAEPDEVPVPAPAGEEDLPPAEDLEVVRELSAGDGSPDDLAATATDETWAAAQEAAGGPVEPNDPPISPGALRALGAAFTSLGVRDDLERHHTTSALLGRKVESWNELHRSDSDRLFKAIEGIKTRDELEALVQRAADEWGASS